MKDKKSLGYTASPSKPVPNVASAPIASKGGEFSQAVTYLNKTVKGNQGGIHKISGKC
jgi:hypothetical protein